MRNAPSKSSGRDAPAPVIISTVSAWELGSQFESTQARKNEALREAKFAKLDGDLSENAPYQAAKEKFRTMGRIQRRLTSEMNDLISKGHRVVDPSEWASSEPIEEVELGAVVLLKRDQEEEAYLIAGARDHHLPAEGDLLPIPYTSPLGQALLEHRRGDRFQSDLNGLPQIIEIIAVRRPTTEEIYHIFPALRG